MKIFSTILKILLLLCLVGLLILANKTHLTPQQPSNQEPPKPEQHPELTETERDWINDHQPIRIAFDGQFPPYSFLDESGAVAGIAYDTMQLLSQKLGLNFIIDERTDWQDIYPAAVNKKVDVVATMVDRPERHKYFLFTSPYVFKSLVIVTHKNNKAIKKRSDLEGKTVALVEGYQYSQRILKEFPNITPFYVSDIRESLSAVESQNAEVAITFFAATHYYQNKYLLSALKVATFYDQNSANDSIAIRNDWPVLQTILQKGLKAISQNEMQAIRNKWLPQLEVTVDYDLLFKIAASFVSVLIIMLLWIRQIKHQNFYIQKARNNLLEVNSELNLLKNNLEQQVEKRTKQLQSSEKKYRSLVENLSEKYFFYQHDSNGIFTYLSPSIHNILGYSINEFLNHYSTYLTDNAENAKIDEYTKKCLSGTKTPAYELEIYHRDGHKCWLEVMENPIFDKSGNCIGVEGLAHDITLLKQTRERLNWLSYYDDLTRLANRRLFNDRFEQTLTRARRQKEQVALLFMDVDRFKMVNDTLGHAAGDIVLQETANRLQQQLRDSDMAARMGGDEFTVILPNTDKAAALIVTEKIIDSLAQPYILNNQQFILGSSIGITIFPQDDTNAETLLQLADSAMYEAKKSNLGFAFSSSDTHKMSNRRVLLEQDLRRALALRQYDETCELKVAFQSKHCTQDQRIVGYEALMRWQHPEMGMISPAEFIPLAEDCGLIMELSHWILTRVCLQTLEWNQSGFDFGKVAINISAVELINLDLATEILKRIDATGAQRDWLDIEITESALMKTPEVAGKIMQQLNDAGLNIAIDDFGTGYSSLSYLKNLPATYIKIDQSFIRGVLNSAQDQAVVNAVLAMSHALGKKVIAEGVESKEQFDYLATNGCDMVQGYWLSKPVSATEIIRSVELVSSAD
jgi:diguanylate cyclase (GGDEF)-like protein/PAS domain S-box-containing protein